jgi:DNA repair protein RecN (Recombination protein N)
MLRGIHITDMLLIDRLDLKFQSGLNVLTGETGAGKSILLDSLGFVLGWRGRADLVRSGATQGVVTAWFDLSIGHPARIILVEAGFPEADELILRRTNASDGRKTAYVNDRRCSGEMLRQLSDVLVELHGQHDDIGLLNPRKHCDLLDEFGSLDTSNVRNAWKAYHLFKKQLEETKTEFTAAQKNQEYLVHSLDEINQLAPETGEDKALDVKRRLMQASIKIREDIKKVSKNLSLDGAEGLLNDASRWLEGVSGQAEGRLDIAISALSRAISELSTSQQGVESCLSSLDFDPLELEQTEERLFSIRALARKHSVLPDDLALFKQELSRKLKGIELGADKIISLEQQLFQAKVDYDKLASDLSVSRKKSAKELEYSMAKELAPLKLEQAIFTTNLEVANASSDGIDTVTFMVSTNPGAPAGPINKIASGGELSRFLLALKVCLTNKTQGITMIFDEIDRGVGGATADAVGQRLSDIAASGQVLVVTHSPQVAAKGAHHWRVQKSVLKGETFTTVVELDTEARINEIARMLAGDIITPEARAAAQALL